jgi:ribonuclease BN (tRNA processing enzyme)
MKITLLGTGVPKPQLHRASSGYMVEVGDDVILFDQGPGTYHRMMEAGKRAVDITHVFFSHLHYDHCLDYARLMLTHWDQGAGKIPELNVYGPPHTKRMNQALFGRNGVFGPDLEARVMAQGSIDVYESRGGTGIRKKPKPKVSEIRSGQTIEGNGWKEYAKGAAGHLEVARMAKEAKAKSLVITHVLPQIDKPGMREKVLREIGAIYKGNIYYGEDLMEIPIGDPMVKSHEK